MFNQKEFFGLAFYLPLVIIIETIACPFEEKKTLFNFCHYFHVWICIFVVLDVHKMIHVSLLSLLVWTVVWVIASVGR